MFERQEIENGYDKMRSFQADDQIYMILAKIVMKFQTFSIIQNKTNRKGYEK